jgi:1A family penicillin-binding protein
MISHILKELSTVFGQPLKILIIAAAVILLIIPVATYAYFVNDLSSKENLMNSNNRGVTLLDRNGKPFFTFYNAKQTSIVPLSDMPESIQHAVIAVEDKDFYNHPGFSIRGIGRSLVADLLHKGIQQGGSTITQQLVKNTLLSPQKSFLRKYQEILLAFEVERRYSKQEILEMYLNSVYFGEGAFGVESAAQTYFGVDAKDLTLAQASLLAGLLPAPSAYSPLSNPPDAALKRQKLVLGLMQEQGYITNAQENAALQDTLTYHHTTTDINTEAPHFALMVKEQLNKQYGEDFLARSGYKVTTTLDLDWQKYAESVVAKQVAALKGNHATNGAAVVIDPKTGEVRALVGSKDWNDDQIGKVNIATSLRQPGSSFKPIVYATAIEEHVITPATILPDKPTTFADDYKPLDYDKKFRGDVLVRRALANSLNIPSVEVLNRLGIPAAVDMGQRMGLTTLSSPSDYGLSLALGAAEVKLIELTNAYAIFANAGVKNDITLITEIKDKKNQSVYQSKSASTQVLSSGTAFLISSILSDNVTRAEEFGNSLTISRPAAVKTGTTENYRDALTIGYTPSLVVGVWVGNNDNTPMDQVAGSLGAAPIWRLLMERFLQGTPVEQFTKPDDVVAESICKDKGLVVKVATSSARQEFFLPGTEPRIPCYAEADTPIPTQPLQPTDEPTQTPPPAPSDTPQPTPTSTPAPTNTPVPTNTPTPTPTRPPLSIVPSKIPTVTP